MIRNVSLALAFAVTLAGCVPATADNARNAVVDVKAIDLAGKAVRCIPKGDIRVTTPSYELKGDLRKRFLTPAAEAAGVRVFIYDTSVTSYGSQTIVYADAADTCVVFSEGISLQEYSQRLGLNPLGVSPFYEPEVKATKPVTSPTVESK